MNIKKFMIFGPARSGSTTLVRILCSNQVPIVFEPFNLRHHNHLNFLPVYGLNKILAIILNKNRGFKHLIKQLDRQKNEILLKKFPTIFLYRQNLFETVLSHIVALKTDIWQANDIMFAKNYTKPIKISETQVLEYVESLQNTINYYIDFIKNNSKDYLIVKYENLFSENGFEKVKEILQFLDSPLLNEKATLELLSPKHKLNKKPWNKIVKNYNELQRHYLKLI